MNQTCNVDINGGEGCERHRGNILRSNSQREKGRGFIVQRLRHQNGRRAVFTIGREVESDRHVGFGHHPVLQVIGHSGVAQLRGGLDSLDGRGKYSICTDDCVCSNDLKMSRSCFRTHPPSPCFMVPTNCCPEQFLSCHFHNL